MTSTKIQDRRPCVLSYAVIVIRTESPKYEAGIWHVAFISEETVFKASFMSYGKLNQNCCTKTQNDIFYV